MAYSWEALPIQRKAEVAWVELKTETTVTLSTGNRRRKRGQTWSVDLEAGLVFPAPSNLYIFYNYHRYCTGVFIFPKKTRLAIFGKSRVQFLCKILSFFLLFLYPSHSSPLHTSKLLLPVSDALENIFL